MRRIFLLIVFCSVAAFGQDYLRIKMKNGSLQSIPLQSINKITFSDLTAVGDRTVLKFGDILKTLTLLQNYPNPFNPTTRIAYHISRPNVVEIRIYDITGRVVRVLERSYQQAGDHLVQWDSRNDAGQMVASGMYVYEIRFEGSVLTRKMMLLK